MKYNIEKNVPAPNEYDYNGRRRLYPLAEMEIGDSFFVPFNENEDISNKKLANSILGCARRSRHNGKKFVIRTQKNSLGVNGVRCWRIK